MSRFSCELKTEYCSCLEDSQPIIKQLNQIHNILKLFSNSCKLALILMIYNISLMGRLQSWETI